MNILKKLLRENKLEKIPISFLEADKLLKSAKEDIFFANKNAEVNIKWSFTILYHAGIKILRALLVSKGLRTKGGSQHVTLLQTSEDLLEQNLKDLFNFLDTMRRKRHHFIYSADEHISQADLKKAFEDIKYLFKLIQKYVRLIDPQKKLFNK